jgi:hypothetical protein
MATRTLFVWPALIGSLICTSLGAYAAPAAKPSPKPSPSPVLSESLSVKLQTLVANSKSQLGTMEPWQKKLFDDEVIPQYQHFIRDYRATNGPNGQVAAEIDFDNLRNYLRFYAPKALKRENPTILVWLNTAADCSICQTNAADIKAIVKSRLEHRGFVGQWAQGNEKLDPAALEQVATAKQASGTAVIEWKVAPADDEDAKEDTEYLLKSSVDIRDVGHSEGQLQILDTGNFARSIGQLLTDAFTDLGAKVERTEITHSEMNRNEVWVEVSGIGDYAQYVAIRDGIRDILKNVASVQEQKIARGKETLAVFTELPVAKIQELLTGTPIGQVKLAPVSTQVIEGTTQLLSLEIPGGSK